MSYTAAALARAAHAPEPKGGSQKVALAEKCLAASAGRGRGGAAQWKVPRSLPAPPALAVAREGFWGRLASTGG
jgi:hypothetical protein